jgi:hypothetical protein
MTISINAPVRAVGLAMLAALAVACGGGDEKPAAKGTESPTGAGKAPKNVVQTPGTAADDGLANAVAVGKTAAAVDLKYDLPVRPAAGQPFEVELVFLPRMPAGTLDVQATGMPGLVVAGGATTTFANVAVGERYAAKVLVQVPEPGLYYIGVTATLTTEAQTDARTFSVPVVIGVLPAVEKATPAAKGTAGGENVETTKAVETTK